MSSSPVDHEQLRHAVRRHYAAAATSRRPAEVEASACGPAGVFGARLYPSDERSTLPQAAVEASLGCGNPTAVADLVPGDIVLDLGSGGGIDLLLSARRVGPAGRAYGLDMTEEMLALARRNLRDAGVTNVELLKGLIEAIPLPAATVDVVISNCVINLSPHKPVVFAEMHRVLRPGGRLGISDVAADDGLPAAKRGELARQVSCVGGALTVPEYRALLDAAGFENVTIDVTHEVAAGMSSVIVRARKRTELVPIDFTIESMTAADWPAVRAIYEEGIATRNATFETTVPDWLEWDGSHLDRPRLVARDGSDIVGWAALSPVSGRCVYAGVAETSLYVAADARGRGVGRRLLAALVEAADRASIWTLQAGIFPENTASIAVHHACGFRTVGIRERLGELDGRWRDVALLERRA